MSQSGPKPDQEPAGWGFEELLVKLRAVERIEPRTIPVPPEDIPQPTPREKQTKFRSFGNELFAEALLALKEAAAKGPELRKDLDPKGPSAEIAAELVNRIETTREAIQRAKRLMALLESQDLLNRHDAYVVLNELYREYEYQKERDPRLKSKYPALESLMKQRASRIAEGKSRAKREREIKRRAGK